MSLLFSKRSNSSFTICDIAKSIVGTKSCTIYEVLTNIRPLINRIQDGGGNESCRTRKSRGTIRPLEWRFQNILCGKDSPQNCSSEASILPRRILWFGLRGVIGPGSFKMTYIH